MNSYQKAGAFIARLVGGVAAMAGAMGPVYVAASKAVGQEVPEYAAERWLGSLLWLAFGLLLIVLAKPIGRLTGRGLQ